MTKEGAGLFVFTLVCVLLVWACEKPLEETDEYQSGYSDGEADGYSAGREDGLVDGRSEICNQLPAPISDKYCY